MVFSGCGTSGRLAFLVAVRFFLVSRVLTVSLLCFYVRILKTTLLIHKHYVFQLYINSKVSPFHYYWLYRSEQFRFLCVFLAFDFCRFCVVNSWERASIFPFECSVLNKGTTGTIFITSLVWCGHWLGIEPVTSCTRSQHSTTRLSRRRYGCMRLKRICNWNTWRFFKRKQYLADILTIVWPVIFMHLYAPSRLLGN